MSKLFLFIDCNHRLAMDKGFDKNEQKHCMGINWLLGIDNKYCVFYYYSFAVCYTSFIAARL